MSLAYRNQRAAVRQADYWNAGNTLNPRPFVARETLHKGAWLVALLHKDAHQRMQSVAAYIAPTGAEITYSVAKDLGYI